MAYPRKRLSEALQVIREDDDRRQTLRDEKLARTQYRDRFQLRQHKSHVSNTVQAWRDDDTSDDEYDPDRKDKPRSRKDVVLEDCFSRGKKSKKRKKTSDGPITSSQDVEGDKVVQPKKQKNDSASSSQDLHSTNSFITLKITSANGKAFLLQKLGEDPLSDIKSFRNADPSPWQSSRGGPRRATNSMIEHEHDFSVAKQVNETLEELELDTPRTLRSGRVRAEAISQKRKQDDISDPARGEEKVAKRIKPSTVNHGQIVHDKKGSDMFNRPNSVNGAVHTWGSSTTVRSATSSAHHGDVFAPAPPKLGHRKTRQPSSGTSFADAIEIDDSDSSSTVTSEKTIFSSVPGNNSSTSPQSTQSTQAIHGTSPPSPTNIITLTTSFSHPIDFKCLDKNKCTFHNNYRHPILGHRPTTGQYIINTNRPSQLIPLASSTPAANDRMCIPCALSYLQITRCTQHHFRALPTSTDSTTTTLLANNAILYFRDLFSPSTSTSTAPTTSPIDSCSLCRIPAAWHCHSPQLRDMTSRPCQLPGETPTTATERISRTQGQNISPLAIQPPMLGCGLKLCTACVALVGEKCAGKLQEHREIVLNEVRGRPVQMLGARADVEFLFVEGLVWLAYYRDGRGEC